MLDYIWCFFSLPVSVGAESGSVLCNPAGASVCVLCLSLSRRGWRLATFWLTFWAAAHLRVWHCHLMARWYWKPTRGWATR